jgi:Ricin-type beta-trefoil lectin domain
MSMSSLRVVPAIVLFLAWVPVPALAQSIDQDFYYKLSTEFRGMEMKLDVFNGGPKNNLTRLKPDQNVTGQFWRLMGNGDGTFRLSTKFRGADMCLDIFNGGPNNNQPHLVNCGNYTGQYWNVAVTEGGDAVRLTTVFRGPSMCLDIFNGGPNNNQPHLAKCAGLTGQRWILTRTDERVEGTAPGPRDGL